MRPQNARDDSSSEKAKTTHIIDYNLHSLNLMMPKKRRPYKNIPNDIHYLERPESRQTVIDWMMTLDTSTKYKVLCIENHPWLVIALVKMKFQLSKNPQSMFKLKKDVDIPPDYQVRDFESTLDDEFDVEDDLEFEKRTAEFKAAEKSMIKNLKICDIIGNYDSIAFSQSSVQHMEKIVELFNTISKGQFLKNLIPFVYEEDHNTLPIWFRPTSNSTIGQWIVAHFESNIVISYIQSLISKAIVIKRYPMEYRDEVKKTFIGLGERRLEELVKDSFSKLKEVSDRNVSTNNTSRRQNILKMIQTISKKVITIDESIQEKTLELCMKTSPSKLVDSMIYPSLNEILSLENLILHQIGEVVYKETFDIIYTNLLKDCRNNYSSDDEKMQKSNKSKRSSRKSKKSKKSKKAKNSSPGEKKETVSDHKTPSEGQNMDKRNQSPNRSVENNVRKPNDVVPLEIELRDLHRHYAGAGDSWQMIETKAEITKKKKKKRNKNSNDAFSQYSCQSNSGASGIRKPMSVRAELAENSLPYFKRTSSFTNSRQDDQKTTSNYTKTLSTMTESNIRPNLQNKTSVSAVHNKPELLVREESNDSISLKSKNSAKFSGGGSTDLEAGIKYPETNSIERNLSNQKKKKSAHLETNVLELINREDFSHQFMAIKYRKLLDHPAQKLLGQRKLPRSDMKSQKIEVSRDLEIPQTPPLFSRNGISTKLQELKLSEQDFPEINSPINPKTSPTKRKKSDIQISKAQRSPGLLSMISESAPQTQFQKKLQKVTLKSLSESLAKDQASLFFYHVLNKSVDSTIAKLRAVELQKEPARARAFERVEKVIKGLFFDREIEVCPFGSWATKILTKNSDIDLCILGFENNDRTVIIEALEHIEIILNEFNWVKETTGIYGASVPVLKMVVDVNLPFWDQKGELECGIKERIGDCLEFEIPENNASEIHIDLVAETTNELNFSQNGGLRTTQYIQASLTYYPALYSLSLLIKILVQERGLGTAYSGGLSSLSISMMVIAFLEKSGNQKCRSNGELLMKFLNYYGKEFDPLKYGICCPCYFQGVRGSSIFERLNFADDSPLLILDPTSYLIKNIARASHRIQEILHLFREIHANFKNLQKNFMNELEIELKTDSGVKKDYFLNYFTKKNKVLGLDSSLCMRLLGISNPE